MIKLFVDDERFPPEGWELAKTSEEALYWLDYLKRHTDPFIAISLDHDLGGDDTTRPVVLWMCEHDFWPEQVYVHTGNPIGEEFLVGMVRRYAPEGTLKGYGLNYWGTSPESVIRND